MALVVLANPGPIPAGIPRKVHRQWMVHILPGHPSLVEQYLMVPEKCHSHANSIVAAVGLSWKGPHGTLFPISSLPFDGLPEQTVKAFNAEPERRSRLMRTVRCWELTEISGAVSDPDDWKN